jgi:predicted metal-dependent hydrolase
MPNKVVHFESIGAVTFFRNRRSKSMKISIKPDKSVLVSYPYFVCEKDVFLFLTKNEAWIKKHQAKMKNQWTKYDSNSELQTKLHNIRFQQGDKNHVQKKGRSVLISVADFNIDDSRQFIEKVITEVYRFEARSLLPGRLRELAREKGFSCNKITIRNNKRNWGSCSSKNNISLNLQMMKLPDELIDYVLLHELVHTEIKNHSAKFWKRLDELTNYRARELALKVKKYSTYTL